MNISQEVSLNGLRKTWKSMDNWMIFILEFEMDLVVHEKSQTYEIIELKCLLAGNLLAK